MVSSTSSKDTKGFLSVGFNDYVAARTLLRGWMLPAAVGLASSSVEKYLKLHAIFKGTPLGRTHLGDSMIDTLKNGVGLPPFANESFLRFLGRCYKLRYFDELDAPFNLVVCRQQVLAELDEFVGMFEKGTQGKHAQNGQNVLTPYQQAVVDNDARVIDDNHFIAGTDKSSFIAQHEVVYEIRFLGEMNYLEFIYVPKASVNDGNFLRSAITPKPGDDRSFELVFEPMQDSHSVTAAGLEGKDVGAPSV